MDSYDILELYHRLFSMIVEDPRIPPKKIAKNLGKTGRGRSPSTMSHHIIQMYKKKISREPTLSLKSFRGSVTTAYFCKISQRGDHVEVFYKLSDDERINHILFLSGSSDFFITTRTPDITFDEYDLEIQEKHTMYTPFSTIPQGWESPVDDTIGRLPDCEFHKGKVSREIGKELEWQDLEWDIYNAMRLGVRKGFSKVAKEIKSWPKTVQTHFYNEVLPCCAVCHYFFPEGYDLYDKAFLRVHTKYEISVIAALKTLSCTSYVFPLEKEIILTIFHRSMTNLMTTIQKMEEIGIIDSYLLHVPLAYTVVSYI
jgi:hypothetical protein